MKRLSRFVILLLVIFFVACRRHSKSISFYYWRTTFHLDTTEKAALRENQVHTLYTRYFDIDRLPGDSSPRSIAPLVFVSTPLNALIVPVIYIKNRTFTSLDTNSIASLVKSIHGLIDAISGSAHVHCSQVQFDCDWTESTRDNYFWFLRQYKSFSKQYISATVRLHQVKYPARSGIPPVDRAVLMYYNMGEIDGGSVRSIYDKTIASRYTPFLKNYPLGLDVALPVFAWGIQLREGKVVKLLNKMSFLDFSSDTNFTRISADRYLARHACFHGGYYFKEQDLVKTEQVSAHDLLDMVQQVTRYSNKPINQLIFYDLDKENLALYDKEIFRTILDRLD